MSINNPFLSVDQKIAGDIYTNMEIWNNLATLCDDFGSRFGGTPGEEKAAKFMQQKLLSYGLPQVYLEPFEYEGWRRGNVSFRLVDPIDKELDCITLPHSPPANLTGSLIDLGDGAPEDFAKRADDIKGKVVLTTSEVYPNGGKRWIHRNEKYGRALLAGAIGFIFINHYPGYGPATGGIGETGAGAIPGISLSYEDGRYLQRLIKKHGNLKIKLTSSDVVETMVSWNVIGELPGQNDPNQIIMLGCHYDGHDISQGATDPASGTVAVMEAARVLAKYAADLPNTIRFALWGVEEIGLIGSTFHVQNLGTELDKFRFYLNMDMAGALNPKDIVLNEWSDLAPLFEKWSDEMALPYKVGQSIHAHSDHYPFLLEGVPTGNIGSLRTGRSGRGYGHTKHDTLDKADVTSLREAADLSARLALRMASKENWPARRRTKEAVAEILKSPDSHAETAIFAQIRTHYEKLRNF